MSFKSIVIVVIQMVCSLYLIRAGGIFPHGLVSLVLIGAGFLLGMWAMMEFRFRFNIFPELLKNSKLITSGPYRFVRHPIYTGVLLITLGFVINFFTLINVLVWMVLLATLLIKIRFEEKILIGRFGDYAEYKRKTKALIPFLL